MLRVGRSVNPVPHLVLILIGNFFCPVTGVSLRWYVLFSVYVAIIVDFDLSVYIGLDIVPLHPDLQNVGSPDLASRITWVQHNL